MLNKLTQWFEAMTHASISDILRSVLLLMVVLIVRAILLRLVTRSKNLSMETKRQWALNLRNLALVITLIGLIIIWSSEIRTLALSLAAVAVAVAVSFKEIITCLISAVMRTASNTYKLGDHIQIGRYKGRVIDISMMTTTLMEIGPGNVFQFTGKAVIFPNSLVFTEPIVHFDFTGDYVAHTIEIPVPYDFPISRAETVLMEIANEICNKHLASARKYMSRMESHHLADTPSVEPRFAIQTIDEKSFRLILRIVIPESEQHGAEQRILQGFSNKIPEILAAAQESPLIEAAQ